MSPRELCEEGYRLLEARRLADALGAFEIAMALRPDCEAPPLGIAHVRFAEGRLMEAGAGLRSALQRMPWSAALHATLAEVHLARGRVGEAREALAAARATNDDVSAQALVFALEEALSCGALGLRPPEKAASPRSA